MDCVSSFNMLPLILLEIEGRILLKESEVPWKEKHMISQENTGWEAGEWKEECFALPNN